MIKEGGRTILKGMNVNTTIKDLNVSGLYMNPSLTNTFLKGNNIKEKVVNDIEAEVKINNSKDVLRKRELAEKIIELREISLVQYIHIHIYRDKQTIPHLVTLG